MNKTRLALLGLVLFLCSVAYAAEVRKLGSNDLEWATPNQGAATTTTSPGGKTVTKIDAAQVPWRSSAGYLDNLVDGTYSITLKPGNVTGDNTDAITGYVLGIKGSSNYHDNLYDGSYLLTPKVADLIAKGPWLDVRGYGATGDGTTDDRAAIQLALDAVPATGATVYFPKGTYIVGNPDNTTLLNFKDYTRISGDGMGISIIKFANSGGKYNAFFAGSSALPARDNIIFENMTIDSNAANNMPSGTFTNFARHSIAVGGGSNILIVRNVEFKDFISVNTIYSGASNSDISHNYFHRVTPYATSQDHSSVYINADNVVISNNRFHGVLGDNNSVTAIETHGSYYTVTGNVIDSYQVGMNITGIQTRGDSVGNVVTGNTINRALNAINIWSQSYLTHTTGYGIDGLIIANNHIYLTPNDWYGTGTTGIIFNSNDNLPVRNVIISGNTLYWDNDTGVHDPNSAHSGIGCYDSTASDSGKYNVRIIYNSIINSWHAGVDLFCKFVDSQVNGNYIVNPGSTVGTYADALRVGILARSVGGKNIEINHNTIIDNAATTKMVYGVGFAADNNTTLVRAIGNYVKVFGDNTTAFLRPYHANTNTQLPFLQSFVDNNYVAPTAYFAAGSWIQDITNNKTYRNISEASTTWIPFWHAGGTLSGACTTNGETVFNVGTDNVLAYKCIGGTWHAIEAP